MNPTDPPVPPASFYLHDDPRVSPAWGPFFTHEYITYYATQPHDWLVALPPVSVLPNPAFTDWAIGPDHVDYYKEGATAVRDLPALQTFDCTTRNGDYETTPPDETIAPWQVLFLYATEPDMDLDCGLDLAPVQKLTKGSHGLRHMQFSLFGKTIGMAEESFHYHVKAARRAAERGNRYWAWRFLSRATHYLADLGHPFHSKVIPYRKLFRYLFSPKKLFRVLAATHNSHEVYTQARFREGFAPFKKALEEGSRAGFEEGVAASAQIGSHNEGDGSGGLLRAALLPYRKKAAKQLTPIFNAQLEHFGKPLLDAYEVIEQVDADMDSSKSTMLAERHAHEVVFADPANPVLAILDEITTRVLRDVGRALGLLFAHLREDPAFQPLVGTPGMINPSRGK